MVIKFISIGEYFEKIIKFYLNNLIYYYRQKEEWKLQLSMKINFISFTRENVSDIMHSKINNVEIMRGISTDDITDMLITSFTERFQDGLETKMTGSSYVFNYINLFEYHFQRISLNRGISYIPTIPCVASKKCSFNPQNKKDKICFVYAMVLALSYHKITNNRHKLSNITPFIQNYNWNDINFSAGSKEYRAFEKYNDSIALNIFYVPDNEKYIGPVYISKFNKTCNYHANLLMITDGKDKWSYFAIRSIPASLRGVTSTHNGDYYCLKCLHSYRTEKKNYRT